MSTDQDHGKDLSAIHSEYLQSVEQQINSFTARDKQHIRSLVPAAGVWNIAGGTARQRANEDVQSAIKTIHRKMASLRNGSFSAR